jgi:gliding motility-associated-like protein
MLNMNLGFIKNILIIIVSYFGFINSTFSQGDDCATAYQINNVSNFCSGAGFFTNNGSTIGSFGVATCLAATSTQDVWFQFTAVGTDALISAGGSGSGGTMMSPCISIYNGDCLTGINEQGCANGTFGSGITQLYEGALIQGSTYYIRISTTTLNEGTFELCVNNYTPSANPGADCGGAAFLCNQNPISVAILSGGGLDNDEPEATSCLENAFGADEGNSSWFYWTCGTAGSLTFDITPLNPVDDIDFMIYQLNSTNPCGPRTVIRCNSSSCLNANGSTGLSLTDLDITEDPNCDPGENAYCQFVSMTVGTTYALLVNNFSANMGFTVNFGGTGTFQGPNPNIVAAPLTICEGQTVTFNGSTSVNVAGGLTWNFSNGGSPASAIGNGPHVITYNTQGTFTAILNGTDANGCQSIETVTVNVNNPPVAPIVANVSYCQGQPSTALTATGTNLLWYTSGIGGTGSALAPIPSTSTVGTTSYYVSQTTAGCESPLAQIDVTITPPPTMIVPVSLADCANNLINSTTFSSTEIGVTYTWTNSNNTIGIGTNGNGNIPTFTGLNTTINDNIGTITVIPSVGTCSGTAITFTLTIFPLPPVNAGSDLSICAGTAITLIASGASTYTWDNAVVDGTSFTPVSTATYTVTGTSVQGCISNDQVLVTINPIPTVSAGLDLIICSGQTAVLTGNGANTYSWDNNVTNGVVFTPSPAITTYTVTGTTTEGCSSTDQMTLQVIPIPAVSFSPDLTLGCSPFTVNFTNTTLNSVNCSWDMGNGNQLIGCGTVSNTFIQAGCYDVTLTVTFATGCTASLTTPNSVCVEPNPIASFVATPSILNEYDSQATFNNTSVGGSTYEWNFGDDTAASFEIDPTHDYAQAGLGNFLVTLIAYSPLGCIDSVQSVIQIKEDLLFYIPNTFTPDEDQFNQWFQPIFTSGFDPYDYTMLIYNRWGEIIFETHNTEIGWNGTYGINRGLVQDGTYNWKVEFKTTDSDERVMKLGHVNIVR